MGLWGAALGGSAAACATGISRRFDGGVLAGLTLAGVLDELLEAGRHKKSL